MLLAYIKYGSEYPFGSEQEPFANDARHSRRCVMNAPQRSSDPHIAIVQLMNDLRQFLDPIGDVVGRSRDAGVNGALIEAQSFLKEAVASLSRAAQLSMPKRFDA